MAIQSAAIIQGGPTSSCKQVVSVIMHSLSKTNVSCEYQLCFAVGDDKSEMLKGNTMMIKSYVQRGCMCIQLFVVSSEAV